KAFLVVIISLLLICILLLRAAFLIEDNSKLLAEFSLDKIAEDAESLSDFDRDYLILNIRKCSQSAAYDVFYNQLHFRKFNRESELITSEAVKIQKKCLRDYVLNAPTSQEALSRNAKLAHHALAPYNTDEMSRIFSDAIIVNYVNTSATLSSKDKHSEKIL
ncbi:hypothetical protein, partial [Alteromonas mediterranea]|uniref:hypothetical protein n=1 Tax=Alteromonas mediterranea TaxID=314275 RepID=UPI002FE21B6C